jgi:hypothetical protein
VAQQRLPCSKILLDSPQGETGHTGLGNRSGRFLPGQSGRTQPRGKNSTHTPIDLPIHSIDQSETLGIDGEPRGLPLARSLVPKTHSIKRNRKSTLKSTSNPRNPKPPKSSPLTHGFGRGITAQRTTKGSHKFSPSNPQEQGPENAPRKSPRGNTENHHQEQPGKTHPNLEEPHRIIYT